MCIPETILEPILPRNWQSCSIDEVASLAPVQSLNWPLLNDMGIELAIKRDDLLHPQMSGNKFYKLFGHIQRYQKSSLSAIASFGGAYSNHIYALAAIGQALNIPTVGIIRGDGSVPLSPTLLDAKAMGMKLVFVSRSEYKQKTDPLWLKTMSQTLGDDVYWVPEGGGDSIGAEGCARWGKQAIKLAPWIPSHICVAAGTGGTAAGLLASSGLIPVHAFLALKGSTASTNEFKDKVLSIADGVRPLLTVNPHEKAKFYLEADYHCGGYARFPGSLREFMLTLEATLNVPLDPVYTAKLFWGIAKKAELGLWSSGSKLLVMHSGGLQGRRGYSL